MAQIPEDYVESKFIYFIVFGSSSADSKKSQPIVDALATHEEMTAPHHLDREITEALPALWYCLHLPTGSTAFYKLHPVHLKDAENFDKGHEVLLAPIDSVWHLSRETVAARGLPTLLFAPDDLAEEAERLSEHLGVELGFVPHSALCPELLSRHWEAIRDRFVPEGDSDAPAIPLCERMDHGPTTLPTWLLARQLRDYEFPDGNGEAMEDLKVWATDLHTAVSVFAEMGRANVPVDEASRTAEARIRGRKLTPVQPVTVVSPSVAPAYCRRLRKSGRTEIRTAWPREDAADVHTTNVSAYSDHQIERKAIEIVAAHHAIAHSGLGLVLPSPSAGMWAALAALEDHCRTVGRPNPGAVRAWLQEIGRLGGEMLTAGDRYALGHAEGVTVLSDFPMGLSVLPGDTAPLCCAVPVTQRPITPLTRCLQMELNGMQSAAFQDGLTVLVAECLPRNDPIRALSDVSWQVARQALADGGIEYAHREIGSPEDLRNAVEELRPGILVASAHGYYSPEANSAGLVIGGRPVQGPELGPMPPVVLLSACHVSPRGRGAVAISYLLFREGAMAVLGTLVPVDVRRNGTLMVRLMVSLAEAALGNRPMANLAEIWHYTAASNAFHDVVGGSERWQAWAMSGAHEASVNHEFKDLRSPGRLRKRHVYRDTEDILIEIADERGVGPAFRQWLRTRGYVPETLLYTMIGWPERVWFGREAR